MLLLLVSRQQATTDFLLPFLASPDASSQGPECGTAEEQKKNKKKKVTVEGDSLPIWLIRPRVWVDARTEAQRRRNPFQAETFCGRWSNNTATLLAVTLWKYAASALLHLLAEERTGGQRGRLGGTSPPVLNSYNWAKIEASVRFLTQLSLATQNARAPLLWWFPSEAHSEAEV